MGGEDLARRKRELEEAIKKAPEDQELHAVYADWLEEQGDHAGAAFIRSKPPAHAFFHVLHRELRERTSRWPPLAEDVAAIRADTFTGARELFDRVEVLARIAQAPEPVKAEILESLASLRTRRLLDGSGESDPQRDQIHLHSFNEIVFHTFFSPDFGIPTDRVDPIDGVLTIKLGVATYTWSGGQTSASITTHDAKALNEYAGAAARDAYLFSGVPDTALGRFITEARLVHRNPLTGTSSLAVLALSHFTSEDDFVEGPWRSLLELTAEMIRARLPASATKRSFNVALERCRAKTL